MRFILSATFLQLVDQSLDPDSLFPDMPEEVPQGSCWTSVVVSGFCSCFTESLFDGYSLVSPKEVNALRSSLVRVSHMAGGGEKELRGFLNLVLKGPALLSCAGSGPWCSRAGPLYGGRTAHAPFSRIMHASLSSFLSSLNLFWFYDLMDSTWAPCCLTGNLITGDINPCYSRNDFTSTFEGCLLGCTSMEDHKCEAAVLEASLTCASLTLLKGLALSPPKDLTLTAQIAGPCVSRRSPLNLS